MNAKNILSWALSLTVWTAGAIILWRVWIYQKTLPDPLGSYIEFTVMFITTFYIFVLILIKQWMNGLLSIHKEFESAFTES